MQQRTCSLQKGILMRPIQQLYYDHGHLFCPVHGRSFIRFMAGDGSGRGFHWCCAALLPDGSHCVHSAAWASIDAIEDEDVRQLTQRLHE
jgi:hypothetical protein